MTKKGLLKLASYKELLSKFLQYSDWDIKAGTITIAQELLNELKPFLIHYSEGKLSGIAILLEDDSIVIRSQGKESGVAFKARHIVKIKRFILSKDKNYLEFSVDEAIQGRSLKDRFLLSTVKSVMNPNARESFIAGALSEMSGIKQIGDSFIVNLDEIPEIKQFFELCIFGVTLKEIGVISFKQVAAQKIILDIAFSDSFLVTIDNLLPEI